MMGDQTEANEKIMKSEETMKNKETMKSEVEFFCQEQDVHKVIDKTKSRLIMLAFRGLKGT